MCSICSLFSNSDLFASIPTFFLPPPGFLDEEGDVDHRLWVLNMEHIFFSQDKRQDGLGGSVR